MDVVQSATAPSITFVLDDYTPERTATARLYIKKGDAEVYNDCTLSGNQVTYTPTTGSFDVPGQCVAQLQIVKGEDVAVSWRIFVRVEPNLILGSAAPATTEFDALTNLIQDAEQYSSAIHDLEYRLDNLSIDESMIEDGSITTDKIAPYAVTGAKIANDSIQTNMIQDNSISTAKIQYGAVTETELANNAVTTPKIQDGAVTTPKLADGSVTESKLGSGLVNEINSKADQSDVDVLEARVDEIISGASVDPDAELIDIRVGYDGTTYATAGDAVRGQVEYAIDNEIGIVNYGVKNIDGYVSESGIIFEQGSFTLNGGDSESSINIRTGHIKGGCYIVNHNKVYEYAVALFNKSGTGLRYLSFSEETSSNFYNDDVAYLPPLKEGSYRIRVRRPNGEYWYEITPETVLLRMYEQKEIEWYVSSVTSSGINYSDNDLLSKPFVSERTNYIEIVNPNKNQFAVYYTQNDTSFTNLSGGWDTSEHKIIPLLKGNKYYVRYPYNNVYIPANYKLAINGIEVNPISQAYGYERDDSTCANSL